MDKYLSILASGVADRHGNIHSIRTQRLPRLIGKGRALETLLTGETIDAQGAHRMGLVKYVVSNEKLLENAEQMANQVGKRYICKKCGAEFIVTRGGKGSLHC